MDESEAGRDVLREAGIAWRHAAKRAAPYGDGMIEGEVIVRRADVERLIAERDEARAQYEVEHAHRLEDLEDNFRLDDELAIARRELEEAQRRSTPAGRSLSADEVQALRQVIRSAEDEFERTGRGSYFCPSQNGWAGCRLQDVLDRAAGVSGEVPASGAITPPRCANCNQTYPLCHCEAFSPSPSPGSGSPTASEGDSLASPDGSAATLEHAANWIANRSGGAADVIELAEDVLSIARALSRRHSNGDTK